MSRMGLQVLSCQCSQEWMVKYDQNTPVQPRDDLNAPDLYIPSMGYVSYVLLAGFLLGAFLVRCRAIPAEGLSPSLVY